MQSYLWARMKSGDGVEQVLNFFRKGIQAAGIQLTRNASRADTKANKMTRGRLSGHNSRGDRIAVSMLRFLDYTDIKITCTPAL